MKNQASQRTGAHRRLSVVGASQFRRLLCGVVVLLAAGVLASCEQNPAGLEQQADSALVQAGNQNGGGGSTASDPVFSDRKGVGTE